MPWLTIIMFFLSYFASKSSGATDAQALVAGGLVAGTTYYTTHETEWGKTNLGQYDGVSVPGVVPVVDGTGAEVKNPDNSTMTNIVNGTRDVLKDWGATGVATVVGTAGAVAGGLFDAKNLPLFLGAGVVLLFLMKG